MTVSMFTLVDGESAYELQASADGDALRVPDKALGAALGWELKPQGFCKDDACYPVPARSTVVTANGVDIRGFAELIGRPLALDAGEGAGYLGVGASVRAERLAALEAPDFTLPDLDGRLHSLSDSKGKKVLLAAYGSW